MAKSKKSFDIVDAAQEDSYNIKTESLSDHVLSNRFKRISGIEKIFYFSIMLTFIILTLGIVFSRTKVIQAEQKLSTIQQEINLEKTSEEELNQQVQELLRSDRVLKIANEKGLKSTDQVKKAEKWMI
jgi:cell division protein FtsL